MDEQSAQLTSEMKSESHVRTNRGWFRAGDRRINREGRPFGSKASAATGINSDFATKPDRVKRLFVLERDLAWRLTKQFGPWAINLPEDYEIVACRVDAARRGVIVIIRSKQFPRIAKGTPIPAFQPEFNGLKWRRPSDDGQGNNWLLGT